MRISTLLVSKLNSSKLGALKETFQKKPRVLITITLLVLIIFFGFKMLTKKVVNTTTPQKLQAAQKVDLGNSISFIGLDMQGKATKSKIKMTFVSAEKSSDVLVKDQSYKAKEGKAFLIVNLELQNDTTDKLNIIPGDLIRLTVGSDDKKYAPDLHNNTVLISPISVKNDRVGFVVDSGVNNFKLLVGELEKKKEEVDIKF